MLFRHGLLVVDHLPQHPECESNRKVMMSLLKRQELVLAQCEQIKPYIKQECDEWEIRRISYEEYRLQQLQKQQQQQSFEQDAIHSHYSPDPFMPTRRPEVHVLNAADQDLAVDLARQEMRRRGDWDSFHAVPSAEDDLDFVIQHQIEAARQLWEKRRGDRGSLGRKSSPSIFTEPTDDTGLPNETRQTYKYPAVIRSGRHVSESTPSSSRDTGQASSPPPHPAKKPKALQPPLIPSKVPIVKNRHVTPPPRPPKEEEAFSSLDPPPMPSNKDRVSFRPSALLEDGSPLRPVFIPRDLRSKFLAVAAENTQRGLEMCGVLCGSPVNNALFVSCLVIPDQTCTENTCETQNEGTMLEFCLDRGLMVIGWIHTHPTQTCFMSSQDLHTHAGYQIMIPESIAIVCAPQSTPS